MVEQAKANCCFITKPRVYAASTLTLFVLGVLKKHRRRAAFVGGAITFTAACWASRTDPWYKGIAQGKESNEELRLLLLAHLYTNNIDDLAKLDAPYADLDINERTLEHEKEFIRALSDGRLEALLNKKVSGIHYADHEKLVAEYPHWFGPKTLGRAIDQTWGRYGGHPLEGMKHFGFLPHLDASPKIEEYRMRQWNLLQLQREDFAMQRDHWKMVFEYGVFPEDKRAGLEDLVWLGTTKRYDNYKHRILHDLKEMIQARGITTVEEAGAQGYPCDDIDDADLVCDHNFAPSDATSLHQLRIWERAGRVTETNIRDHITSMGENLDRVHAFGGKEAIALSEHKEALEQIGLRRFINDPTKEILIYPESAKEPLKAYEAALKRLKEEHEARLDEVRKAGRLEMERLSKQLQALSEPSKIAKVYEEGTADDLRRAFGRFLKALAEQEHPDVTAAKADLAQKEWTLVLIASGLKEGFDAYREKYAQRVEELEATRAAAQAKYDKHGMVQDAEKAVKAKDMLRQLQGHPLRTDATETKAQQALEHIEQARAILVSAQKVEAQYRAEAKTYAEDLVKSEQAPPEVLKYEATPHLLAPLKKYREARGKSQAVRDQVEALEQACAKVKQENKEALEQATRDGNEAIKRDATAVLFDLRKAVGL